MHDALVRRLVRIRDSEHEDGRRRAHREHYVVRKTERHWPLQIQRIPPRRDRCNGLTAMWSLWSSNTLINSQLPVSTWHEWLNDTTLADAIVDRIVHAADKIALR